MLMAEITGVSEVDLEEAMGPASVHGCCDNPDVVKAYKISLATAKGQFDLEFRNDSNGYYGGTLEPFGGILPDDLASLTEDL